MPRFVVLCLVAQCSLVGALHSWTVQEEGPSTRDSESLAGFGPDALVVPALEDAEAAPANASAPAAYYWPHARGHVGHYSVTEYVAPSNLSGALSWLWHHPEGRYHTVVVSAPLIDDKKNIYLATEDGFRKFTQNGTLLWYTPAIGSGVTCPSIMDGLLFGSSQKGWIFALDMETGQERWSEQKSLGLGGDTAYVEAHDGVVVTGVDSGPNGGSNRVLGLNATDGKTLWEFWPDKVMWNCMPVFTNDGSVMVMDISGGVYKHALHNGTLLWKAAPPNISGSSFTSGGLMLGPDGTAYTCSNHAGSGQQGQHGALRAYALEDGRLLWDRFLEYPCNSWPAVSANGTSVVVPTGAFVAAPSTGNMEMLLKNRMFPFQMQTYSLSLGNKELQTYGMPDKSAAVQAFNATSGELLWTAELPPYGRLAARGDEEGYLERKTLWHRDQCLPAQLSSPTIAGDGSIYVGRADGSLYQIEARDNGTFHTFDAEAGFLHPGTSWAPGMMAVASCDGLFVWNY